MDPLEVLSFNISWACTISFVWGSSWDDSRCKSSCQSVAFPKMHLFLDDKIISEIPKSSKQCFASLSIHSDMSSKTPFFWYQSFPKCHCQNHWKLWKN